MFDVNHVSRTLKDARVRKNLTQSALADRLGVTYQAVSNWERGASIPDIANLSTLCEILNLDLYELIGASQNRELVEEVLSSADALNNAPIKAIAAVASALPPEQLMKTVRAQRSAIRDMATLIQLAPFVDGELLEELGETLTPSHVGEVIALAPFVSHEMCAKWIERLESFEDFELDLGLLSALGPFLSAETMDRLSERVIPDSLVLLTAVAPFLSADALDRLAEKLERVTPDDYFIGLACLQPFLGREAMKRLRKKIVDD